MKTIGIIAEYNPFHKGHAYQIAYARKALGADRIVVAMSGDYVQRGAPALLSKQQRTRMALLGGADLVLEIPPVFSTASAEGFAMGGVSLLEGLGVVDVLCYGSEYEEESLEPEIAQLLAREPAPYRENLRALLKTGMTFPAARSRAVAASFPDIQRKKIHRLLSAPNSILGIEYRKALLRLQSPIKPVSIRRRGQAYLTEELPAAEEGNFASSSAIRKALLAGTPQRDSDDFPENLAAAVPEDTGRILRKARREGALLTQEDFSLLLFDRLLFVTEEELLSFPGIPEALARRMLRLRSRYQSFSQFSDLLKTRDITHGAVRRGLIQLLLELKSVQETVPYARVLGFRRDSTDLLHRIKKQASIPLLTKLPNARKVLDEKGLAILGESTRASNLYQAVLSSKTGQPFVHEYEKPLIQEPDPVKAPRPSS
ncbi:MAG: nucleotidyltransferase family protein [Clostridiales bacterium]|nr:nucleotidyltransferase family protein [Clostridiales bacterium]